MRRPVRHAENNDSPNALAGPKTEMQAAGMCRPLATEDQTPAPGQAPAKSEEVNAIKDVGIGVREPRRNSVRRAGQLPLTGGTALDRASGSLALRNHLVYALDHNNILVDSESTH
jgi:hypothetical protein